MGRHLEPPRFPTKPSNPEVTGEMEDGVIRREMVLWPSELESILFGTEDPDGIEDLIRAHCRNHLGLQLREILFYRRGVGAVFGISVEGGDGIVVKVHRADLVGLRLDGVVLVQRHLATQGLAAPMPLAAPAPLALGIATSEELLDKGEIGNGHDPAVRGTLARGLFEFVEAATPLTSHAQVLPGHLFSGGDALWPIPHDARFDLSLHGGEWIDEIAAAAKRRLREPSGCLVVGHEDWRVENLRVDAGRIVAIFDWDSVVLAHEPALIGQNPTGFTADWSDPDSQPYPSLDESAAFIRDYEAARGQPFTREERETADAASLFALAYKARCEHSDSTLGVFPDAPTEDQWMARPAA